MTLDKCDSNRHVIRVTDERELGIEELAGLGGVTRRTVRYYVQEGLLPAPRGVGRGRHYGPEHLDRLLAVKAMQERGESLVSLHNGKIVFNEEVIRHGTAGLASIALTYLNR